MKGCLPKALPIRIFLPRKTLQPSTWSINYLYESGLGVYGCDTPTRHNPAQKVIAQIAKNIQLPAFPLRISRQMFFAKSLIFFLTPNYFSLSAQKKFVTNLLTCITKFVTRITNFVTSVTNFITKTILYDRKNYLADSENYLADNKKLSCG